MAVNELIGLEDYQEALKQPGIAVVDFYSTQCPPCKVRRSDTCCYFMPHSLTLISQVIAPFYENIAKKFSNVRFYKVNTKHLPLLASSLASAHSLR